MKIRCKFLAVILSVSLILLTLESSTFTLFADGAETTLDDTISAEVSNRIRMVYGDIDDETFNRYFEVGYQLRMLDQDDSKACSTSPSRYFIIEDPVLYARYLTRQYALTWYNSNNPAFSTWPLDCANFASQCLYAGGADMIGSPSVQNSTDYSKWYSYGTANNTTNISETWRAATGFYLHWSNRAVSCSIFSQSQMGVNGAAYNYAQSGDVISLMHADGTVYHTMVVVGKYGGNLYLAAHTSNTCTATLVEKANASPGGCVIYNVFGY